MHLLFLGIVKSNVVQLDDWMKENDLGVTTFHRSSQDLLKALSGLNQSWLLAEPFLWSIKNSYTTGTWVGKNWLAWIRLSKVTGCYFLGLKVERIGSSDVLCLLVAHHCLVVHLLLHSGVTRELTEVVDALIKEFLSCSRELDIQLRYTQINKKKKKGKTPEQF